MKSNIEFLYEELRKATDGGSESMTHDDALKQIAYWRDKCSQAQAVEPVATVQCINGVTIGYLDVMQPVGTKLYLHPATPPEPTVKQSLMVHASAEDYMRYKYGAYRGHFAWRELEEAYSQGRYDELQAQGPIPWPDDAPEVHYQRGYAVALSDAEEAIDDECRERVVTASDCIEIIRNLGAETEATADDADLIVAKLNALSEAQQVAVPMTDQQIAEAYYQGTCQPLRSQDKTFAFAFSRAIEAFHGITGAKP